MERSKILIMILMFLTSCTKDIEVKDIGDSRKIEKQVDIFGKLSSDENEFIRGDWEIKWIDIRKTSRISIKEEFKNVYDSVFSSSIKVLLTDEGLFDLKGNLVAMRNNNNNAVFIFQNLDTLNGQYFLKRVDFSKGKMIVLQSPGYQYYQNDNLIGQKNVKLYLVRNEIPIEVKKYMKNRKVMSDKKDTIDFNN